jgi:hypothetical protein
VDGSPLADGPREQDELDGLRNGHEVPRHVRMRDGDRPTVDDLLAKELEDAALAAHHVAEADDDEATAGRCADMANDGLADPLGRPHDGAGIDGLVRAHEDEGLDVVLGCHSGHDSRSPDVRQNRWTRVLFGERHVLVGGGVQHDRRTVRAESSGDVVRDGHVAEDRDDLDRGEPTPQLLVDVEERRLAPLEEDEGFDVEGRELAA